MMRIRYCHLAKFKSQMSNWGHLFGLCLLSSMTGDKDIFVFFYNTAVFRFWIYRRQKAKSANKMALDCGDDPVPNL